MDRPVVIVVEDDPDDLEILRSELERRYAADYEIVPLTRGNDALGELLRCHAQGRRVAMVLAPKTVEPDPLTFFASVAAIDQSARRVLTFTWGDRPVQVISAKGFEEGHLHRWIGKPWRTRDERFHASITELLYAWSDERDPVFPMVRVIGRRWEGRVHDVRDILSRNSVPHRFFEAGTDEANAFLAELGVTDERLPVVVMQHGEVLIDPSNVQVAAALGVRTHAPQDRYDIAVIGAGPAGLAASVYASSEGLRTVMIEPVAMGGQAGTTSLIRNYLGFPSGIAGAALASRAFEQSWLFGSELVYGHPVVGLRTEDGLQVLTLDNGEEIRARAAVIATGVTYRTLDVAGLDALVGSGVYYGAAMTEARLLEGEHAVVVGGGNSAGQAAVYLARYAKKVTVLVRGDSLAASMSDYLVKELEREPKIDVRFRTEIVGVSGEGKLEELTLEGPQGRSTVPSGACFILIGAQPHTDWLPDAIERDGGGYVITGGNLSPREPRPHVYETSMPGVFAVGDVRHGSIKRVASAVGDGSIAVRMIHDYLAETDQSS